MNLWSSGRKTRRSPSGWVSGNAVCCHHNGESADTRGRGGMHLTNNGGVSYHCFNCHFTTGWEPGRPLGHKFRKFLKWAGADENTVQRLVLEAMRIREIVVLTEPVKIDTSEINFTPRPLPDSAVSFADITDTTPEMISAITYVADRGIDLTKYNFFYSPDRDQDLYRRVIIPFYHRSKIIGYTARLVEGTSSRKFYSSYEPNYVFNLDKQRPESRVVIVCEGPFDAMSIDGVAVLSNRINETQVDIIESLGKEVIVVPDFDKHIAKNGKEVWPGADLINDAMSFGWSVSFPVWMETCKDVNEALIKYGKLFTLQAILKGREHSRIKIELQKKKYQKKHGN